MASKEITPSAEALCKAIGQFTAVAGITHPGWIEDRASELYSLAAKVRAERRHDSGDMPKDAPSLSPEPRAGLTQQHIDAIADIINVAWWVNDSDQRKIIGHALANLIEAIRPGYDMQGFLDKAHLPDCATLTEAAARKHPKA